MEKASHQDPFLPRLLKSFGISFLFVCLVFLFPGLLAGLLWPGFAIAGLFFGDYTSTHAMVPVVIAIGANIVSYGLFVYLLWGAYRNWAGRD